MERNKPVVCAITPTKGRHRMLERVLGMYLSQDYSAISYNLIYNNSIKKQALTGNIDRNKVILINRNVSCKTNLPYSSLQEILTDALTYIPNDVEVITFMEDDDEYLPNHITEGVRGYLEALSLGKKAYKPHYSYLNDTSTQISNVCEPSYFVSKEHVLEHGFGDISASTHLKWIDALVSEGTLHQPVNGVPTFIYRWNNGVYHMSGGGNDVCNFTNHNLANIDEGDGIITPMYGKK